MLQSFFLPNNEKELPQNMAEITQLDNDYEKKALAQANLNALNGNASTQMPAFMNKEEVTLLSTLETTEESTDMLDSVEYRKAFMNYVTKNAAIPSKFVNADANTKTTDIGSMIPTTVLNKIIEKIENISVILPLVTRTSYKGGLEIPTSNVKPVATWVAEGAGSDKQKKVTGSITFSYHKLRCAISMSLEVETMALSAFESKFISDVSYAMTKALEDAIINGDGSGKPKGILAETPIADQSIKVSTAEAISYNTLINMEAALPTAYEKGARWFMTKKTFMQFAGMTDDAGQPVARTNYGIAGRPERNLIGRSVVLLDEYMDSYSSSVAEDTIVAFIFNPADYILNTNLNITVKSYEDNDTEDKITKAFMITDGKVVDNNSLVTLTITA